MNDGDLQNKIFDKYIYIIILRIQHMPIVEKLNLLRHL